jgi:hypothetical protein
MTLTFEWDGETVHKETSGFEGKACTEKTAFIEKALGGHATNRRFKDEYHKRKKKTFDSGLTA